MEVDFFYDGPFILFPRREVDKNDPCKHFDTWLNSRWKHIARHKSPTYCKASFLVPTTLFSYSYLLSPPQFPTPQILPHSSPQMFIGSHWKVTSWPPNFPCYHIVKLKCLLIKKIFTSNAQDFRGRWIVSDRRGVLQIMLKKLRVDFLSY